MTEFDWKELAYWIPSMILILIASVQSKRIDVAGKRIDNLQQRLDLANKRIDGLEGDGR